MNKIAIISGSGNLPLYIGKELLKKKFDVTFFLLNSVENEKLYAKYHHLKIELISIKKIIKALNKNHISKLIFAG